ncbi:hypothetical protein [Phytoactinopolyspora mesophila]|uniref:Uncharacterized protein n=1 Tax=Phytoactinopolyspora mesophila TaxID=2650750 RepID=A0A7K3MA69_9ACTN|nr:hypothetical protein [Phytoactinopolyspora mesophila]NDL60231.1 hypothetical protein [Phytoactinopolyspora mesophila]
MAVPADMQTRRKPYLLEKGEPLLIATDPIMAAIRFGDVVADTGIDETSLLSSPLCAVALPKYPASWGQDMRRWEGTDARMMWHPLLWLPHRVAARYVDSEGEMEDDHAWAARVSLELTQAGFYEDASGTWLDVLSLIGIDIDTDEGSQRVEAWLEGAADSALDSLDLTEHLDVSDDPHWALESVAELMPDLWAVSSALAADSLLETTDDLLAENEMGREDVTYACGVVASLALAFVTAPEVSGSAWEQIRDRLRTSGDVADQRTQLHELSARLRSVRDQYWPAVEELRRQTQGVLDSIRS